LLRVNWNSEDGSLDVDVDVMDGGGAGQTTISRHWGPVWVAFLVEGERACSPVGVLIVFSWGAEVGATDWKAWIGRASKNSWATMKGVLSSPIYV
jgi:hypothetical protein